MSSFPLQGGCSVQVLENALTPQEYSDFIRIGSEYGPQLKQPTSYTYGHRPKFKDVTFDFGITGVPNRGYAHMPITTQIFNFCKIIKDRYNEEVPQNPYERLFNCNLVHYAPDFDLDGGRGKHQDNPSVDLGLVLIYSWGEARTLNIFDEGRIVLKVEMNHNSILAMEGVNFQKMYSHCVRKLKRTVTQRNRHSFNIRYFN
jgi:hypothetical protein